MLDISKFIVYKDQKIVISGSYGNLSVDARSGLVIDYTPSEPKEEDYSDIVRFDVEEYRKYYGIVEDTDILLIGFWTKNGQYEPPCKEHRQLIKEEIERGEKEKAIRDTLGKVGTAIQECMSVSGLGISERALGKILRAQEFLEDASKLLVQSLKSLGNDLEFSQTGSNNDG